MKIVSVTNSNREDDMIVDALKSVVNLVDECIVINTTGRQKDYSIEESVVGDKLVKVDYKILEHTAEAKNYDLIVANRRNADWALLVDTDERIHCNINLREFLATTTADVITSRISDGKYTKERIIRIPAKGMFEGVVHEYFISKNKTKLDGITFTELPKSPELIEQKCKFIIGHLEKELKAFPDNPRHRQYLGAAYSGLKQYDKAIEQFSYILNIDGDKEMSAIAHSYTAMCYFELGKHKEVIDICMRGLVYQPTAELFFLAAYSAWILGDVKRCICYAELAITAGEFRGYEFFLERVSMRNVPMLYEGPYELLVKAFEAINDEQAFQLYTKKLDQAKLERIRKYN